MTVNEIIMTQPFLGSVVIAGKEGLKHEFSWCSPDIYVDVDKEVWTITSLLVFYIGRPDGVSWEKYFERLIRQTSVGVVFLGIDYKKFGITDEAIKYCNEHSFPLIWLPKDISISIFINHIFPLLSGVELQEYTRQMWLKEMVHTEGLYDEVFSIAYGYNRKYSYVCSIVKLIGDKKEADFGAERYMTRIQEFLVSCFSFEDARPLSFIEVNSLVSFIPFLPGTKKSTIKKCMKNASAEIKKICEEKYRRKVSVGTLMHSIEDFRMSYIRAFKTQKLVDCLGIHKSVYFYDDWHMHMMLIDRPRHELNNFMKETLKPLYEDSILMETLTMYLICGENLRETAEKLFVHISTLRYRLNKITELLDYDLTDTTTRFKLRMAITIYRYLEGIKSENET